jgi:drug/metabolite transporter (DMT)-like permease
MSEQPEQEPGRGAAAGHLALIGANLIFGLFPVYGRVAMDPERGVTPYSLAAWRIVCGTVMFVLLARVAYPRRWRIQRGDVLPLIGLGLLGIVANQVLYLTGLERSNAANAGVMMCVIPVFTFLIAAGLKQERFGWLRGLGVTISLLGVLPLVLTEGVSLGGERALGNLLIAINCLCYSFYLVWVKPLRARYPAVVLLAWIYVFSLPCVPLLAWGQPLTPAVPDARAWWSIFYVVIGPTVVAYGLNAFALGRVRASTSALYIYMQPVMAALGGALVLGEQLGGEVLLAAACLFPGVALVTRKDPR